MDHICTFLCNSLPSNVSCNLFKRGEKNTLMMSRSQKCMYQSYKVTYYIHVLYINFILFYFFFD